MKVPFVDLKAQYASLKPELDAAISRVVADTAFIGGRHVAEFEKAFAKYVGVDHCVAVANGTDAIEIALRVIGIKPGDEVIVPANTFLATAEGVSNIGAVPVFADNDAATYNIDPEKVEAAITSKTKAILPVHLYGLPADMDSIMTIARRHGLKVLEDCAQAHGATHNEGRKCGTLGDAATFSFYPSKNLGAFGDGGAIVTKSEEHASNARLIANHGQAAKNRHTIVGRNSRMDGLQAAVLSVKLPHLDRWLKMRRANAAIYNELLGESGIALPGAPDHSAHTYHLYVVQVPDRDSVQAKLTEAGVETGLHYPTPVPLMEAYLDLGYSREDFPVAGSQMDRILSLPMYAELTREQIEHVCATLLRAVSQASAAAE